MRARLKGWDATKGNSVAKAKRTRSVAKTSGKRATARGKAGKSATSKLVVRAPTAKKRSSTAAAGKKSAPKRPTAKKAAAPKRAARKLSAGMSATKKKKKTAKTTATKKAITKKTPAKKATARKASVKKRAPTKTRTTAKKTVAKKTLAKKTLAKKTVAKKASAKTRPAKQATARKAPAKKTTKKAAPARAAAKRPPRKKAAAKKTALKTVATKKPPTKPARAKKAASKTASAQKTAALKAAPKKASSAKKTRRGEPATASNKTPKVELAPRSSVVAPTIPIPVKKVPRKPTLEERARKARRRIGQQSVEFRAGYDDNFAMSWIYHDSALEGVVYTFEELTAAFCSDEVTVVDSSVMPIYDAIRRHRIAIDFVRNAAEKKRAAISVDFLKDLYVILHPEEGEAKSVKYRRDTPQHRLYFHEYAAPDKIAYRVRQVIEWVNSPQAKKIAGVLRTAARAHYDLARTYPFQHDSGKVARLFMNFLLMRAGLPPAIVHATERQRYYEALKAPSAANLVKMLRDSVANALASIEKLLDEHETRTRGYLT